MERGEKVCCCVGPWARLQITGWFWARKSVGIGSDWDLRRSDLAERAELHPNYLGRVERGEEHVSVASLRSIAKALGVRVRDLIQF